MDFLNSSLFTPWIDPESGVTSFILTTRVAPIQQSFYYTNPSLSSDGRYYWFYCAFPPSGSAIYGRCLAVADFLNQTVRYFPETQFSHASPMLHASTGEVYWANFSGIWKLRPEGEPALVNRFTSKFQNNRPVPRYATHFTLSTDGTALNVDADVGNDRVIGKAPLNGDEIEVWQVARLNFNHAQFSPTDPDLMLVAQDSHLDRETGTIRKSDNRLWLIRRGEELQPVYPQADNAPYAASSINPHFENQMPMKVTDRRAMHGHEWWSAGGEYIWYIHYQTGVERVRVGETTPELVWPHRTVSHAHSSSLDEYLVMDSLPPEDPSDRRVTFVNLKTKRSVNIVSQLPGHDPEWGRYHIHPHPQFCGRDQFVCYTTTVLGGVDVAFTRVSDLLAATKGT